MRRKIVIFLVSVLSLLVYILLFRKVGFDLEWEHMPTIIFYSSLLYSPWLFIMGLFHKPMYNYIHKEDDADI
jgi:hypothetical protein